MTTVHALHGVFEWAVTRVNGRLMARVAVLDGVRMAALGDGEQEVLERAPGLGAVPVDGR